MATDSSTLVKRCSVVDSSGSQCERQATNHDICAAHNARLLRTGDVQADKPFQRRITKAASEAAAERGLRWCPDCQDFSSRDRFYSGPAKDGLSIYCKTHFNVRQTQVNRKRMYGVSDEEYQRMLEDHDGVCAICLSNETALSRSGQVLPLAVDHDHISGVVRGLLCGRHNRGLGFFGDNPQLLLRAFTYLTGKSVKVLDD